MCLPAAAQNTCPPGITPCVGQGPFRLFIGPLNDFVAAGQRDFFWAVRDANQDLNGTSFFDLSSFGRWSSSDPTVATIDNTGAATTYKAGTTTIAFKSGPFQASTTFTVLPPIISFITVTPSNPTVPIPGGTQTFTAIATYTDNTTKDITNTATWTSGSAMIATMASNVATTGTTPGSTFIRATDQASGVYGQTGLNAGMTCIALSPTTPTANAGSALTFTATGYFGPGNCSDPTNFDVSFYVDWASSNTTVANIDQTGFVVALTAGDTTISASSFRQGTTPLVGSTNLHVNPPTLNSLAIQPAADVTIPEGGTQQYTAIGTYSDFSTQNLTNSVTWTSSDTTVATIGSHSINSGLAQANTTKTGSTTITATISGCGGTCVTSVTLNVTLPVLQSITVAPANPSIARGNTQQFTATGNYSAGPPQDLTASVMWTSNTTSVATINTSGLASGVGQGSSTITATLGSVSGTANLTVTAAVLTSISITPSTLQTINSGQTEQYTATGHYSDTSTRNITNSVNWQSDNTSVATINASGLATGVATVSGTANIHATDPSTAINSNTAQLTVTVVALQSIVVTPGTPSVSQGSTQQFVAIGHFSDNSTLDITNSVIWNSDNTNVAQVCDVNSSCAPKGQAQTLAAGTAHVTASKNSIPSNNTTLTVNSATLQSITIAPIHSFVVENTTRQFTATGHFSDNSTRNLTDVVTWSSSDTSLVGISNSAGTAGLASAANRTGTVTITATITQDGTHSASTDLTVTLF